jgi:hypothetical protein
VALLTTIPEMSCFLRLVIDTSAFKSHSFL